MVDSSYENWIMQKTGLSGNRIHELPDNPVTIILLIMETGFFFQNTDYTEPTGISVAQIIRSSESSNRIIRQPDYPVLGLFSC